jgi:hypothetical protein
MVLFFVTRIINFIIFRDIMDNTQITIAYVIVMMELFSVGYI